MSKGYTRPTYILSCDGVVLLTLDAEITPPFAEGQHVDLVNEMDHHVDCYVVTQVRRRVAYHTTRRYEDRVPLAGQEVTVELEQLNEKEKNHAQVVL